MAGGCNDRCAVPNAGLDSQRRTLRIVLALNLAMFVIEVAAGWHAGSIALQADALDFLGDSANYAIALYVLTRSVAWRAGTALLKGVTMFGFGLFLFGLGIQNALSGTVPGAPVMGVVGTLALLVNVVAAVLLFRFRGGDANLRAVWLCSRNDALGNLAVLAAAAGVALLASPWPDLLVGFGIAGLAIWSGLSVVRQARAELRSAYPATV